MFGVRVDYNSGAGTYFESSGAIYNLELSAWTHILAYYDASEGQARMGFYINGEFFQKAVVMPPEQL